MSSYVASMLEISRLTVFINNFVHIIRALRPVVSSAEFAMSLKSSTTAPVG